MFTVTRKDEEVFERSSSNEEGEENFGTFSRDEKGEHF